MQLQERETENQIALKQRITVYLEREIPVVLRKGVKRQKKGLSFKASLKLHRWVTKQMFELDIYRWLQEEIARVAGPEYKVDTVSFGLTYHRHPVHFTLPRNTN